MVITRPQPRKLEGGERKPSGWYICTVRGEAMAKDILRIELATDHDVSACMEPAELQLRETGGPGVARFVFENPRVLRIRCEGIGLRLVRDDWRPFDHLFPHSEGRWVLNSYLNRCHYALCRLAGEVKIAAPWERVRCPSATIELHPGEAGGVAELAMEEFARSWEPREYGRSFADCREETDTAWQAWRKRFGETEAQWAETRDAAAWLTWSCAVAPEGYLSREAVLMSKYKMTNFWTWDHCFNVLGLAGADPRMAWDQLILAYRHQDVSGQLPASFNNAGQHWMDAKPPVQGWTLAKLMNEFDWVTPAQLEEIYDPMAAQTDWWFRYRDPDGSGLPAAFHGNDTGWDNASVFDNGPPVRTPDLSSYLVLQMETLAEVADRLGKEKEGNRWRKRAEETLERLIDTLWNPDKGRFDSRVLRDGGCWAPGESLINQMPIVLGKRLPKEIREAIRSHLLREGGLRTEWGVATEAVDSGFYDGRGYWRGPIWAPSSLLVIDGLAKSGFVRDAEALRTDYLRLCRESGFPENFEAMTGEPLRDPTYTWTSGVFLYLLGRQ